MLCNRRPLVGLSLSLLSLIGMNLVPGRALSEPTRDRLPTPYLVADEVDDLPVIEVEDEPQGEADIVDRAIATGSFNTWIGLLRQVGLDDDLRAAGPFTVFAPTDAAFSALPRRVQNALADDPTLMAQVLTYHVVINRQALTADVLRNVTSIQSLEGVIDIRRNGSRIYLNDARVVDRDIMATNGVIHAIDRVMIPPHLLEAINRIN